jgi:hypothetical protein
VLAAASGAVPPSDHLPPAPVIRLADALEAAPEWPNMCEDMAALLRLLATGRALGAAPQGSARTLLIFT